MSLNIIFAADKTVITLFLPIYPSFMGFKF